MSAANDVFVGGSGNDTVDGLAGADSLTGNGGADVFSYLGVAGGTNSLAGGGAVSAGDTLLDFTSGTDQINVNANAVTAIAAVNGLRQGGAGTAAGTGNLGTDIGTAVTAGGGIAANGAAVVTITGTSAGTYLVLDSNGNGAYNAAADAVIRLGGTSSTTLASSDFV